MLGFSTWANAAFQQSIFFAAEAATVPHWSRISDHVGRKPVIMTGLAGLSLSMCCFGLSRTFWGAVIRFESFSSLRPGVRCLSLFPRRQPKFEWRSEWQHRRHEEYVGRDHRLYKYRADLCIQTNSVVRRCLPWVRRSAPVPIRTLICSP